MRWSKLKQRIEESFADCARGRVEVWTTRYRGAHDQEGEAWITIDKRRVHSMGSLSYLVEFHERNNRVRDRSNYFSSEEADEHRSIREEVQESLTREGFIDQWEFNESLFEYTNLSVDQIMMFNRSIVRAMGMFDRRLGKRRLRSLAVFDEEWLVRDFYRLRCAFEGIRRRSGA